MNLPSAAPLNGQSLIWFPEFEMGYFPVIEGHNGDSIYNREYFENYARMGDTDVGKRLTRARLDLVAKWAPHDPVIDVGVGALAFVDARNHLGAPTFGWDVNPIAVELLAARDLLLDPTEVHPASNGHRMAMTFWDSIEHIKEPDPMLRNAQWVFCSLPIFRTLEHVLGSKHFKPREHCWYWLRDGFIRWMCQRGFTCREHNTAESLLGREDIHSFAFQRQEAPR